MAQTMAQTIRTEMDVIEIRSWDHAIGHLLRGAEGPDVVVGPVQWTLSDGLASKQWFILIATRGEGPTARLIDGDNNGLRCDKILVKDAANNADAQVWRNRFLIELAKHNDIIVHEMDSELAASCRDTPCSRGKMRTNIECWLRRSSPSTCQ
jgi:hypothetical protein